VDKHSGPGTNLSWLLPEREGKRERGKEEKEEKRERGKEKK